jgi:hypothetical protein
MIPDAGSRRAFVPDRLGKPSDDSMILPLQGAAAAISLVVSMAYAQFCFLPRISAENPFDAYDAYRYNALAEWLASWPVDRIWTEQLVGVERTGYVRFLALVYHFVTIDPFVGCLANWGLWLGAGILLSRTFRSRALFVLWMVVPDAVDWAGTTSKEPLSAFILAACLSLAVGAGSASLPGALVRTLGAVAVAVAGFEVRTALPIIGVVAPLVVLGQRFWPRRGSWTGAAILVPIAIAYAFHNSLGIDLFGEREGFLQDARWGYSQNSLLQMFSSSDPRLDLLYLPVRAITHIVSPMHTAPWTLPLAEVANASLLQWSSALLYLVLGCCIVLRLTSRDRKLGPPEIAAGWTALVALFLLGASGIIHERYRSVILPAYVPFGWISLRMELESRGHQRVLALLSGGSIVGLTSYLALKALA